MKSLLMFLLTELAVLAALGIFLQISDLAAWLAAHGVPLLYVLLFAVATGAAGALIFLIFGRRFVLLFLGAWLLERHENRRHTWLLETLAQQARRLGVACPQLALYQSAELNAFATGFGRNSAMIVLSTGMVERLHTGELEAVLAHELSHISTGDMPALALAQGALNTLLAPAHFLRRFGGRLLGPAFAAGLATVVSLTMQITACWLASLLVMGFSRWAEFRADQGAARLVGAGKMFTVLACLRAGVHDRGAPDEWPVSGIFGYLGQGVRRICLSHPSLTERMAALQRLPSFH